MPEFTSSTTGDHYLSPDDYATIYDLTPLYSAGYDSTAQKIVIAVRCTIGHSDVEQFRPAFGLPVNGPQLVLVPGSQDPGSGNMQDCDEAYLDVEWLGAVNVPASVPEVLLCGGAEFNEARGNYWAGTNSSTFASVLEYVLEAVAVSWPRPEVPAWQNTLGVQSAGMRSAGHSIDGCRSRWLSRLLWGQSPLLPALLRLPG